MHGHYFSVLWEHDPAGKAASMYRSSMVIIMHRWIVLLIMFVSLLICSHCYAQSFMKASGHLQGGVLLAYPSHDNQNKLFIEKLAARLSQSGWSVLMQPLVFSEASNWEDTLAKQLAVIRRKSNSRVIFIGYTTPWEPLKRYFRKPQAKQVSGLVLLSAANGDSVPVSKRSDEDPEGRVNVRFPVFDIVAQFDYQPVLEAWKIRKKEFNRNYQRLQVPGVRHGYLYHEQMLQEVLNDWMAGLAKPKVHRLLAN